MFDGVKPKPVSVCLLAQPDKPLPRLISHVCVGIGAIMLTTGSVITNIGTKHFLPPIVIRRRMMRVRMKIQPGLEPPPLFWAYKASVLEALEFISSPGI